MVPCLSSHDLFAIGSAALNFTLFLVAHTIALRRSRSQKAYAAITSTFLVGLVGDILLVLWLSSRAHFSWGTVVYLGFLSATIYLFLVFHYMAFVFGLGETAIRVRLLSEIDAKPTKSATWREICEHYNAQIILKIRLERLISSNYLVEEGMCYLARTTALKIQRWISEGLKRMLGIQQHSVFDQVTTSS